MKETMRTEKQVRKNTNKKDRKKGIAEDSLQFKYIPNNSKYIN